MGVQFEAGSQSWDHMLARKNLRWAEGYLKGAFEIVVVKDFGIVGDFKVKGLTRFKPYPVASVPLCDPHVVVWESGVLHRRDYSYLPVFVGVVDFIQSPERKILSLCRLDLIAYKNPNLFEWGTFESAFDYTGEILPILSNWEDEALLRIKSKKYSADEVIQGVSKISHNVTHNQADVVLKEMSSKADFFNSIGRIFLNLLGDPMNTVGFEGQNKGLKILRGPMGFGE